MTNAQIFFYIFQQYISPCQNHFDQPKRHFRRKKNLIKQILWNFSLTCANFSRLGLRASGFWHKLMYMYSLHTNPLARNQGNVKLNSDK
jgi:hypothetical protein